MIILNDGTEHKIGENFLPNIETIAFSLSHINRFTGHVGGYSVAQHCVLIAEQMIKDGLPSDVVLAGLLHDAPEAYIGDVSAPLKRHLPEYKSIESVYHAVIDDFFGVDTESCMVKEYDLRMLVTEARSFGMPLEKFPQVEPFDMEISGWSAEVACCKFIMLYQHLVAERRL